MNENKVIKGTGLLGRFLGGLVKLGDVYKRDGDDLNKFESIIDDLLKLNGFTEIPDNWITKSNPKDLKITGASGIEIDFAASANIPEGEGSLSLSFNNKKTAFVNLKNAVTYELALGEIKNDIIRIWKEKDYEKQPRRFVLVNKLIRAKSGTIIYSEERNNKIGLKAKTPDVPLIDLEPTGSGKVSIVSSRSEHLEVISENEFEPLFGAVRLNKQGRFKAVD
ncbi:MAG: hypothetical protein KAI29_02440 [Cyclobacteriaceae bacterium]|nr:hypothetical protein [Cyclobacteriaceae bacterium]